jgi:hypothetical protein
MIKTNLEPIDEKDMDLEGKLKRGSTEISQEKEVSAAAVEKEFPMEIISAEKDNAYGKILSKVQTQSDNDTDQAEVSRDAKIGIAKNDAQAQVSHLVDLAGQKGIVHAVKVARHMEDNYILDTFHDKLLSEELHNALVAKGMIKEL